MHRFNKISCSVLETSAFGKNLCSVSFCWIFFNQCFWKFSAKPICPSKLAYSWKFDSKLQKMFHIWPFLFILCFILLSGWSNISSSTHTISVGHKLFLTCCLLEIFAVIRTNSGGWAIKGSGFLVPESIYNVTLFVLNLIW